MTEISICIPTYNRDYFLNVLLASIASQLDEVAPFSVEICISDNASSDDTESVVSGWIERVKDKANVVYSVNEENLGPDLNYLKSVEISSGSYCWLMGSDDALEDGALAALQQHIQDDQDRVDLYLSSRTECDINLQKLQVRDWLSDSASDLLFDFSKDGTFAEYCEKAQSIGALFSYLSSIVVRRAAWVRRPFDSSFVGTAYAHVYILLGILAAGGVLRYMPFPLVKCRGGNDFFMAEGWCKRVLIDLLGYRRLAKALLLSRGIDGPLKQVVRREQPPHNLLVACARSECRGQRADLTLCAWYFEYPVWVSFALGLSWVFNYLGALVKVKDFMKARS